MDDFDRPNSEQLTDLHVYLIPPDHWRVHLHSAVNTIINEAVSAGFVRVLPECTIYQLRSELEQQLGYEILPQEYVFLKSVGRCLTRVRPKQEFQLKVKNFLPPTAYAPEVFVLEATPEIRNIPYSSTSSQSSLRQNGATPRRGGDTTPRSDRSEFTGHKPIPPIQNNTRGIQTSPQPLLPHEQERVEQLLREEEDEEEERRRRRLLEEAAEQRRRAREQEEERRRREEEKRRREEEEEEERRRREEERRRDEEERRRRAQEQLEDELRRREDEEERRSQDDRRRSLESEGEEPDQRGRDRSRGGSRSQSTEPSELAELREQLRVAKLQRQDMERQREELVKKAKHLQNRTQQRRNQARDTWKKRYYEEKKKTAPLEEQTNKLRHELESLHRKIMSQLEGSKGDPRGVSGNKPSQQSNLKIQATRLSHDIEELQRRVENVKMKLTTEMKLRTQAEGELKALRAELTQKKISLALNRSGAQQSQLAVGQNHPATHGYKGQNVAHLVSPRS